MGEHEPAGPDATLLAKAAPSWGVGGLPLSPFVAFACIILLCSCQETKPVVDKPLPEAVAYSFVDKATVAPNTPIEYTLAVDSDEKIDVKIPPVGEKIKGLRMVDYSETEKEEHHRKIKERRYTLHADFAGSYILPAIEIPYTTPKNEKKTLKTAEIFVEVKPPSGDKEEDIRDIKPLHLIPRKWMEVMIGIVLGILMVVGLLLFRKRRKKAVPEETPIPPRERALAAIDRLVAEWESHNLTPKRLHYALSDILRIYLEGRFKICATDMTQEEIRVAIKPFPEMGNDQKRLLLDLLSQTDLVKFTDYALPGEAHRSLLSSARLFVKQAEGSA